MAFMNQLNSITASIQNLKPNLSQVVEKANQAKQNLVPIFNKCTQQLDAIGKFLPVSSATKQSPIDLLPMSTAFDGTLENASFTFNYNEVCQIVVKNTGACVSLVYPESNNIDMISSVFPDHQYHLQNINFHYGTEPMNGSQHTVAGIGYAGEVNFIHRNIKYPTIEIASKQPDGIVAFCVFLNETYDDNLNLIPLTNVIAHVNYADTQCVMQSFRSVSFLPSNERGKEFWAYEGSETVYPFRESVKWIVFRSAISISSSQLDKFRQLMGTKSEEEAERKMNSIRVIQPLNSRLIRSSFKSVAQANIG
uniref:Alpha-carbonic anhydrase domain-containing protein n=1 Tax=Rhabditophanes sp. KR3021 TaxID=114890 RepID=A0AC35UA91_9BILA